MVFLEAISKSCHLLHRQQCAAKPYRAFARSARVSRDRGCMASRYPMYGGLLVNSPGNPPPGDPPVLADVIGAAKATDVVIAGFNVE